MSSNKKVIKNSFIYTVSNILLKACGFFLIPIYTRFLSTEEYGIIGVVQGFSSVAIYLVMFSLFSAVLRFYADIKDNREKVKKYIGTIFTFCIFTNVIFLLVCFCGQKIVSHVFFSGIDFFPIVVLSLVYTSVLSLYTLYQDILKSMQLARKSAITSFLYFAVQFVLCIVFVIAFRGGATGTIFAFLLTQVIFCGIAFWDLKKMDVFQFCIDREMLKESLKYSIPIIPHNLSTYIAQYISKLFISGSHSLATVGIFNLALQFGLVADTVQGSVNAAFQPWFFEQLNNEQSVSKKNIVDLTKILTWAYCFVFILIGFFSKEAIEIISSKEYHEAWKVVPLIVLTYAIKIPYYFYVSVLFFYKKATSKVFLITVSTSILNIIFSAWLIPEYGMLGSVFADIISMSFRVALVVIFSKKVSTVSFGLINIVGRIAYTVLIMGIFLFPVYAIDDIHFMLVVLIKSVGVLVFIVGVLLIERSNLHNIKRGIVDKLGTVVRKVKNKEKK